MSPLISGYSWPDERKKSQNTSAFFGLSFMSRVMMFWCCLIALELGFNFTSSFDSFSPAHSDNAVRLCHSKAKGRSVTGSALIKKKHFMDGKNRWMKVILIFMIIFQSLSLSPEHVRWCMCVCERGSAAPPTPPSHPSPLPPLPLLFPSLRTSATLLLLPLSWLEGSQGSQKECEQQQVAVPGRRRAASQKEKKKK